MLKLFSKSSTRVRLIIYPLTLLIGFYILSPGIFSGQSSKQYNGFDINHTALVPITEIHHGGPPRDGIPSIDNPLFIPASEARFLSLNDRVIGLITQSGPKAYPIRILNWHEIINDGDVVISYCPLCGTGMAFKSPMADFGVSGLLYNSDMLLYDRATDSLWSQIPGKAISGKRKGESLKMLAAENTSWENWQNQHPDTQVLSDKTGFSRNYSQSPYVNYESNESLYFPVSAKNPRFHPKEKVIGIELNGHYKAYAFIELDKSGDSVIQDKIGEHTIEVHFNSMHRSGFIRLSSGETLPSLTSYWFAWYTFHPETDVYSFKK